MLYNYYKKISFKKLLSFIDIINKDYKRYNISVPKEVFENNDLTNYYDIVQVDNDVVIYKFETSSGSAELTVFNILDKERYYYIENDVLKNEIKKSLNFNEG